MATSTPRINRLERNAIQNGNFDFWQRMPSAVTAITVSSGTKTFLADRWACARAAFTISYAQETDVPSTAPLARYSASLTSTGTSTAASRICEFRYHFEGSDFTQFIGKKAALQFWVKSSVAGTYCTNMGFGGLEPSKLVQEFSVAQANTWELKTLEIPQIPTGAWQTANLLGLQLAIVASRGSDFNTAGPVGSWSASHTGGSTANVANNTWGSNASHVFKISQVMMVPIEPSMSVANLGALEFVRHGRNIMEELASCQRYFEKSTSHDVPMYTAANVSTQHEESACARSVHAGGSGSNHNTFFHKYAVQKRLITNTVTIWNVGTAGAAPNTTVGFQSTGGTNSTPSASVFGQNAVGWTIQIANGTAGIGNCHYTSDSEF